MGVADKVRRSVVSQGADSQRCWNGLDIPPNNSFDILESHAMLYHVPPGLNIGSPLLDPVHQEWNVIPPVSTSP